jgi:hypothetical protein
MSLYAFTKNSNDLRVKAHFIKYCTVFRKVIKEAKIQHYSRLGGKSHDKIKATRNITKKETVKMQVFRNYTNFITCRKSCFHTKAYTVWF